MAVVLTWTQEEGNERFHIDRRLGNGGWFVIGSGAGYTYSDTAAVPGNTYSYRVYVIADGVLSPPSNEVTVTVPVPTPKAPQNLQYRICSIR